MINVVQVGYGYWGTNVARNLMAARNANLYAICDSRQESLDKARKVYLDTVEYSLEYQKYLDDPRVDAFAVVIQTEPSYQVALDVLAAGKHLFIEKPMASKISAAWPTRKGGSSTATTSWCIIRSSVTSKTWWIQASWAT